MAVEEQGFEPVSENFGPGRVTLGLRKHLVYATAFLGESCLSHSLCTCLTRSTHLLVRPEPESVRKFLRADQVPE